MRIGENSEHGIVLMSDDTREQALLGRLVMNVNSHSYFAAYVIRGELNYPHLPLQRGDLRLPEEPMCIAEVAGFSKRGPNPFPEPEPETEWVNGVECYESDLTT